MENFDTSSFIKEFKKLQTAIYINSGKHGFWNGPYNDNFPTKIALIHSELSEALEYNRKGDEGSDHITSFKGVEEELADVVIRCMDLAERYDYNLVGAIIAKHLFNLSRPMMHGGKKY